MYEVRSPAAAHGARAHWPPPIHLRLLHDHTLRPGVGLLKFPPVQRQVELVHLAQTGSVGLTQHPGT